MLGSTGVSMPSLTHPGLPMPILCSYAKSTLEYINMSHTASLTESQVYPVVHQCSNCINKEYGHSMRFERLGVLYWCLD
ncbi:hypothetical protein FKM82_006740 [Ascaphus truei]